ncbi:MAG: IS256 family transposase [Bdellovibrio sp. CG11_big_fil_rev_8_21_14_0_20_39_38]|nr:MAG: IS256 family transposase [Bdellovibrio sp. CG11_big_fil_rev_8_21_14_0_20_39_38]
MLQLSVNLPELREMAKNIPQLGANGVMDLMKLDIKSQATDFINGLMECEFELFLGRDKYERVSGLQISDRILRNGHYQRTFAVKGLGRLNVKVPRDRKGKYQTKVLEPYKRNEASIEEDVAVLYLLGQSTRSLSLISERLLGTKISASKVSECSGRLIESVEKWRSRPLTASFKYLYLDGTNFSMRIDKKIIKVCVLVVIGVDENGVKQVIALQAGDKESAGTWRQLFKDLKVRGLDKRGVKLGIMDGLPGLEKVFREEFPEAKVQRCQVHVARNVMSKVPHNMRQKVADDMRSVFYSDTKKKSLIFFDEFKMKYEKDIPSAVKCLESSLDSTLCYLSFPKEEWISLRTTNPIERLNKEFKRRTKSMEIVAGEASCYNLLAVISLRMEVYWKRHPITFQKSLPWFKSGK